MAGDINAYSPIWNSHCYKKQNATIFEEPIKQFGLLINNDPERATRPSNREVLLIDLALSLPQLSPLTLWKIPEKYPLLSDHKLIVLQWEDVGHNLISSKDGQITSWDIQVLINDEKSLEVTKLD